MRTECNDNEHLNQERPEATRFFRSKFENSGQPGRNPDPGEHFYFGRCEEHARHDHLNHNLLVEVSKEEFLVAGVMLA